jgi:hypothetical protein
MQGVGSNLSAVLIFVLLPKLAAKGLQRESRLVMLYEHGVGLKLCAVFIRVYKFSFWKIENKIPHPLFPKFPTAPNLVALCPHGIPW